MGSWGLLEALKKTGWPPIEVTLGQTPKDCTCYHSEGKGKGSHLMLLRAKTQRELKWGVSGCWIAHYIYYYTRGLREAIHRAMYCA